MNERPDPHTKLVTELLELTDYLDANACSMQVNELSHLEKIAKVFVLKVSIAKGVVED